MFSYESDLLNISSLHTECPTVPSKRCPPTPIDKKLQKCGPCGGLPAYPRYIQERLAAVPAPPLENEKDKGKGKGKDKDGKDAKNAKDGKGKKGKRQTGGAVHCVGNPKICPSAVYDDTYPPVCEGRLEATRKRSYVDPKDPNYDAACDNGELV